MLFVVLTRFFSRIAKKRTARERLAKAIRGLSTPLVPLVTLALHSGNVADMLLMVFVFLFLQALAFLVEPSPARRQAKAVAKTTRGAGTRTPLMRIR